MGSGMARNLLQAGFPVSVYNRSPERAQPFASLGARVAGTPGEAAEGAEFVISMVSDDTASRAVWLGEEGALARAAPGAILIESSTVTVEWVRELGEAARTQGNELLDAPVTGTKPHAAAGELLFLVGGSDAALERARPVLAAMSRDIVHVGPPGSGSLIKLVNNFMCGVQAASLAEAIAMIEKGGLDYDRAVDILISGAPGSPLIRTLVGRIASGDFTPNFELRLMMKDLTYASKEGGALGVQLTTADAAREVFRVAAAAGYAADDIAAVARPYLPR
jgi:3-hydroxyisobutyrate dehydrogenase